MAILPAPQLSVLKDQRRYTGIGSPYQFLESVGLTSVLEHIYRGNTIMDVADELSISITVLLRWIEENGHALKVETAEQISADFYVSEGTRLLRKATTDFELKKAKEVASHGRWLASKLDKSKFGGDTQQAGNTGATVTYIFNVGNKTQQAKMGAEPIDVTPSRQELPILDDTLNHIPLVFNPVGLMAIERDAEYIID